MCVYDLRANLWHLCSENANQTLIQMTKKKITLLTGILIGLLSLGFLLLNTFADLEEPTISATEYRQQTETERNKKDAFFREDTGSPIADKRSFTHLTYYSPDLAYRVSARLEPFADAGQKMTVRMSDGSEEVYEKQAHAVFELNGQACRLLITKTNGKYSILFRDGTSGKTTYGGGRYLDLEADQLTGNRAMLDFNAAYNPYCTYNASYACPLPPTENTLPVAVEAGEKQVAGQHRSTD